MEKAWTTMRLTMQIATKLNRSHRVNSEVAYLLPYLGRTEEDMQASGPQAVSMENTFSSILGSQVSLVTRDIRGSATRRYVRAAGQQVRMQESTDGFVQP
jgi:hypothetical protein